MTERRWGWRPDVPDPRDLRYSAVMKPVDLPERVDLREHCPPVEDQGEIGSCVAQSLVGMLEYLERRERGKHVNLSRLFLYYGARLLEGTVREDAGAEIRDGIKTLVKVGVCPEIHWPYVESKFARRPTKVAFARALPRRIGEYRRLRTGREMKACLAAGYPFAFGFTVFESFESDEVARTGVAPTPGKGEKDLGGHAVLAVGFDSKAGTYLCRNSWGPDWGQGGYFTLPMALVEDDMHADDFWTIRRRVL